MTTDNTSLTLVLGGTGKTGRRVAERLSARGLPVRVASRSGAPAFDWYQRDTWPAALAGVGALYVAYHPDLAVPGAADHVSALCELAVASGVRRIVLLSGRGEQGVLPSEHAVRRSGAAFTILRCAYFAQNFSEGHLLEPVLSGEVAFPAGAVAEPFVDIDDVADVAVAALTDARHDGKVYELTGPRLLTFAQVASEIGRASGRAVRYVPVTPAEYGAALRGHVPDELITFLTQLFAETLDGHNAYLSDGVQQALGRAPRDFAEYARAAAKTGAWQP
jgi:uncharacterized protein YbjT (DUF2867 family)